VSADTGQEPRAPTGGRPGPPLAHALRPNPLLVPRAHHPTPHAFAPHTAPHHHASLANSRTAPLHPAPPDPPTVPRPDLLYAPHGRARGRPGVHWGRLGARAGAWLRGASGRADALRVRPGERVARRGGVGESAHGDLHERRDRARDGTAHRFPLRARRGTRRG